MRKWLVLVLVMLALARLAQPRATAQPCEQRLPASLAEAGSDGQTFADVSPSHPFYAEIEWLYQNGFSAGRAAHPLGYSSDVTINRAESTVFVEHEIHGADLLPPQPSSQTFADGALEAKYAKWAETLCLDHHTAGCGADPLSLFP